MSKTSDQHASTDLTLEEIERNWIVDADSAVTPVLSVVMPTMNEEEGVKECIERVKRAVADLEVPTEIIISDSSSDRTPEIARELGAIVVEPDELGYGYAYRYAFAQARGDFIVMGDADTTYDFEQIPRLLEHLQETDADIVMGSRLAGEIKPGSMPTLHQYVGNPVLTKFLNTFYKAGVTDAHSGFRIIRREAFEVMDLKTDGMEFASEMIMEASASGLQIEEVPIVYHERVGEEKLDSFADGWRHVRFMLVNAPGYLFSVPGLSLVGLGMVVMTLVTIGQSVNGVTPGVHAMIGGSLLTILGFQIASLGVFTAVASEPIRGPDDVITNWVTEYITLERGATAGLLLFVAGTIAASILIAQWASNGFATRSFTIGSMISFTLIIIGAQTVFSSFFLSILFRESGR